MNTITKTEKNRFALTPELLSNFQEKNPDVEWIQLFRNGEVKLCVHYHNKLHEFFVDNEIFIYPKVQQIEWRDWIINGKKPGLKKFVSSTKETSVIGEIGIIKTKTIKRTPIYRGIEKTKNDTDAVILAIEIEDLIPSKVNIDKHYYWLYTLDNCEIYCKYNRDDLEDNKVIRFYKYSNENQTHYVSHDGTF